jgi:hypothetical protein
MPAQTVGATARTKFFVEFDTAPAMVNDLVDEETQEPIDLTEPGTTVVLNVSWSSPHGSYYTSPRDRIISQQSCVIDPDQVTHPGRVAYTPGIEANVDAMSPPGAFNYQHEVTFGVSGGTQTVPANTYQPLIIRSKVGGRAFNPAPAP